MYKNEYIAHYGIRGMRWGVRRFQNDDGSLTPRGAKKQSKQDTKQKSKQNKSNSQDSMTRKRASGLKTIGTLLAVNYVGGIGMAKYLLQSGPQRAAGAAIVAGAATLGVGSIVNYAKNRKGGE